MNRQCGCLESTSTGLDSSERWILRSWNISGAFQKRFHQSSWTGVRSTYGFVPMLCKAARTLQCHENSKRMMLGPAKKDCRENALGGCLEGGEITRTRPSLLPEAACTLTVHLFATEDFIRIPQDVCFARKLLILGGSIENRPDLPKVKNHRFSSPKRPWKSCSIMDFQANSCGK